MGLLVFEVLEEFFQFRQFCLADFTGAQGLDG
jgi:hypothetical protein